MNSSTNEFLIHEVKPITAPRFPLQTKCDKRKTQTSTEAKAQDKHITDINTGDRM